MFDFFYYLISFVNIILELCTISSAAVMLQISPLWDQSRSSSSEEQQKKLLRGRWKPFACSPCDDTLTSPNIRANVGTTNASDAQMCASALLIHRSLIFSSQFRLKLGLSGYFCTTWLHYEVCVAFILDILTSIGGEVKVPLMATVLFGGSFVFRPVVWVPFTSQARSVLWLSYCLMFHWWE